LTLPVLRLSIAEGFSTSDEIFTVEAASTEEVYHWFHPPATCTPWTSDRACEARRKGEACRTESEA